MGNRKRAAKKTRKDVEDSEVEHLGTVVPEQQLLEDTEHQSEQLQNDADKETQPLRDEEQPENTDAEAADPVDDNEAEAADPVDDNEAELPAANNEQETHQPNRKKQRGPTRMKHIAKEPNTREKVEYNEMGEAVGPGSVKLSSYVGCLVREHIPVIFADWRLVNEELKTVLWRSIKARFELDEEYQRTAVMAQMGCLWRSFKSRVVTKIRNATTNKERMDLRPKNVTSVNDWRRFVRAKTSHSFKVVSDKFKARRKKQIPHTSSRKGMVRLREEMKKECPDPSKVTRLQVWVKSRTKKDGTPVNTIAAEKIIKAAELESDAPSTTTNPNSDGLSQLLGADNPGRLRAMGRGMSKSKLSILQVNSKCMAEMKKQQVSLQRKVEDLQVVIEHLKRGEPETGENSARSVTNRAHPKCLLLDYTGTGEIVAEGRVMSSDPEYFVNGIPLGPDALRVLVESAIKEDACLWRPATNILNMEQAVGEMIAWPNTDCIFSEDNAPKSPKTTAPNKCTLKNWRGNEEVIIAEGRWESKEPEALVNGLPIGPNAVKVFVDVVIEPKTFLWRPTTEIYHMEHCLKNFVAWPASRVDYETTSDESPLSQSQIPTPNMQLVSSHSQRSQSTPSAPMKKAKSVVNSPLQRSPRQKNNTVSKENQKCLLMDITGENQVVAEGIWSSNDPAQFVHNVPLGPKAVRVWVEVVLVNDAAVWRRTSAIECMEDAAGTTLAWPEDKVVMV